jgi:transposase
MSNDRFNHNVDRRVKLKAAPLQRVEVITGVERRRDWTAEEKLAIIAESCQDGAVISEVARRHGLRPQQLFTWRNGFRKREAARRLCGGTPAFAPVLISGARTAAAAIETAAMTALPSPAGQTPPEHSVPRSGALRSAEQRPPRQRKLEAGATKAAGVAPVEIVLGCATVRLHGAADAKTLAAVLAAVKAIA